MSSAESDSLPVLGRSELEGGWQEKHWIMFLAFCHKYEIKVGREEAINSLSARFYLRQAHQLKLAHLYDIEEWKGPPIRRLLRMPAKCFIEQDYEDLGPGIMFKIQDIRNKVHEHNLWLQLQVLTVVHAVGCTMDEIGCGSDWDAHYRATVLWLIHPNHLYRKTGEQVLELFTVLHPQSMTPACRDMTISSVMESQGFTHAAELIEQGVADILKLASG
jgi:hypothetical protein